MSRTPADAVPHGHPFRFVERTEALGSGTVALVLGTAGGTLTGAGPWPVGLVAEALAQAILLVASPERQDELRLVGLDRVEVHQALEAGDRLEVEVREIGALGELRRYESRATRGGALAACAQVTVRA